MFYWWTIYSRPARPVPLPAGRFEMRKCLLQFSLAKPRYNAETILKKIWAHYVPTLYFTTNSFCKNVLKNNDTANCRYYKFFLLSVYFYRTWYTTQVKLDTSIILYVHFSFSVFFFVLNFMLPACRPNFAESCQHQTKGWAGLIYRVRLHACFLDWLHCSSRYLTQHWVYCACYQPASADGCRNSVGDGIMSSR